jgi:hypothetical protein
MIMNHRILRCTIGLTLLTSVPGAVNARAGFDVTPNLNYLTVHAGDSETSTFTFTGDYDGTLSSAYLAANVGSGFSDAVWGAAWEFPDPGFQSGNGNPFSSATISAPDSFAANQPFDVVVNWTAAGGGDAAPGNYWFSVELIASGGATGSLTWLTLEPVPEPATLAFAGLGALGCVLLFWRRKS